MALAHHLPRRFTYADYLRWPEDERWELIDGEAWNMSPAPTLGHQAVSMRLSLLLGNHFRERGCQVFAAPVDVALAPAAAADHEIDTVVQPDLIVVCDPDKLRGTHVRGAPDLVVEIASPSSLRRDERIKRDRYQRAGVAEYWIVHTEGHLIHRYTLSAGQYGAPDVFGPEDGTFTSTRFPDLLVDLPQLFEVEPPPPQAPPSPAGQ